MDEREAGPRTRGPARGRQEAERIEAAEKAERAVIEAAEITMEAEPDVEVRLAAAVPPQQTMLVSSDDLVRAFTKAIAQFGGGYPAAATAGSSAIGATLTAEQERLALDYDALRTALGRRGAASIVLYRIVGCDYDGKAYASSGSDDQPAAVVIEHGHVDTDSWIVVYGPQYEQRDGPHGEIGRAQYCPDGPTCIPNLHIGQRIHRLEVHDRHDRPVRLGRPLPHHVTRVIEP